MASDRKKIEQNYAVIDAGSREVKMFIFEKPRTEDGAPRGRAKYTYSIPPAGAPDRMVLVLHDAIIRAIRECGPISQCLIGARPCLCETKLSYWRLQFAKPRILAAHDQVARAFHILLDKKKSALGHTFADPLEVFVNGYSGIERVFQERKNTKGALAHEIAFHTALLYGRESGGIQRLSQISRMFSGISFRIVSLLAPWRAALARMRVDALLFIDGDCAHTSLLLIRRGNVSSFSSFAAFPYNKENQEAWARDFLSAIRTFSKNGPLPERAYVCGTPAFMRGYAPLLRRGEWLTFFSHANRPRLIHAQGSAVFSGDTGGGFLNTPDDFSLAALARYALNFQENANFFIRNLELKIKN